MPGTVKAGPHVRPPPPLPLPLLLPESEVAALHNDLRTPTYVLASTEQLEELRAIIVSLEGTLIWLSQDFPEDELREGAWQAAKLATRAERVWRAVVV